MSTQGHTQTNLIFRRKGKKKKKKNYNKQNVEFRYSKHAEMSSSNRFAFTRRFPPITYKTLTALDFD